MGRRLRPEVVNEAGEGTSDTSNPPPRKWGKPSNYRTEFCQRVVELGGQGYSLAMIMADIGAASRQTIYEWIKAHREFKESMERARDLALAWWEHKGLENAGNRDFNSNLYRIIMMARFGGDGYREKQIIEHIKGESQLDVAQLSSEEREVLARLLEKARMPDQSLTNGPDSPAKPQITSGSVH